LSEETFCHAGERKSPRVTEEGPETPPEASSETVAVASSSSSSSELSSAKAQKRDPPAARHSGRGERGERGRGRNAGARAGEGIASATPQEGSEGEPTVIFSVRINSLLICFFSVMYVLHYYYFFKKKIPITLRWCFSPNQQHHALFFLDRRHRYNTHTSEESTQLRYKSLHI
jgi:hypothetical protein